MGNELKPSSDGATRASFWRRHRWVGWVSGAAVLVIVGLGIAVVVAMRRAEPMMRAMIVERLEAQFHAKVELDSFHVSVGHGLWAEGNGLRIWPPADFYAGQNADANPDANASQSANANQDANANHGANAGQGANAGTAGGSGQGKPLIELAEFRFHAPLRFRPGVPIHVSKVELEGLVVDVPPRPPRQQNQQPNRDPKSAANTPQKPEGVEAKATDALVKVLVDEVECRNAQLTMETNKPGKLPMQFAIDHINVTNVSTTEPMNFEAQLTNPRPKGKILSKGKFGPWVVEDPGQTAVEGDYQFENADLGTIKGIGGTLNSTGKYDGVLHEIAVDGVTDTPNFYLADFGSPMPLHTEFRARVDGTDGDTWLEQVQATLGKSHFTTQGKIVRGPAKVGGDEHGAGHDIFLTVDVPRGRMEDFLKLTSKSDNPLLTGAVNVKSTVELHPGVDKVENRIQLKGAFSLDDAQFTSTKVQDEIGSLSMRGEGRPKDVKSDAAADVRSTMQGTYAMAGGTITLTKLIYTVPGAEIDLTGKYGVADGALDFTGEAKMQATVSQMVGGWKGALLKPADRFFKKDGAGTAVPIHVDGTRKDPHFGVDFKRMKKTSPERPGGL